MQCTDLPIPHFSLPRHHSLPNPMCLASIVMTDAELNAMSIVDFASATAEMTVSKPAADRLLAGSPEQIARNFFSDPTGQFFAGIWESTPGKWRVRYTEAEFCHITRGLVEIEDDRGRCPHFPDWRLFRGTRWFLRHLVRERTYRQALRNLRICLKIEQTAHFVPEYGANAEVEASGWID